MTNRPSLLEAALAYAEYGWAVLPLHSVENGNCSCRKLTCKSPGKHPITSHLALKMHPKIRYNQRLVCEVAERKYRHCDRFYIGACCR